MVADANALGAPKVLAEASNAVQAENTAVAEAEAEGIDCNCKKKKDCDCDLDLGASCIKIPTAPCISPPDVCCKGDMGCGTVRSNEISFSSASTVNIQRLPDHGKLYDRESTSAAVDTTCHQECAKGCKYRHFSIKGDICVSEQVTYKENSVEDSAGSGRAVKAEYECENSDCDCHDYKPDCYTVKAKAPLEVICNDGCKSNYDRDCSCKDDKKRDDKWIRVEKFQRTCSNPKDCDEGYECKGKETNTLV